MYKYVSWNGSFERTWDKVQNQKSNMIVLLQVSKVGHDMKISYDTQIDIKQKQKKIVVCTDEID